MKYALATALLAITSFASPVFADDGNVPQSTLDSLGLTGMETLSDEDGSQIRGMSGNAMAMGLTVLSGILFDPNSNSFVVGVDANSAISSAENAGLQVLTQAASAQQSAISLTLNVTSPNVFTGMLVGGAGGSAAASSQ